MRIGRITATESRPTTIDEFFFWTSPNTVLKPFDVIKVDHMDSTTFGVIEEISHITDAPNYLSSYISNDFGDVDYQGNTARLGMNYVKAKVLGNTNGIYTPVHDSSAVSLATRDEIAVALGLNEIHHKLVCGYLEMYEYAEEPITIPVYLDKKFLIGPEGAHLNISGISGLASKTSYAMFLLNAIQQQFNGDGDESIGFIFLNVKGKDLLAIDETNPELTDNDKNIYENILGMASQPFTNVKYLYPYSKPSEGKSNTYNSQEAIQSQIERGKAGYYKYTFDNDKESLDLLFSNIDDPTQTIESILNYIVTGQGGFDTAKTWGHLKEKTHERTQAGFQGDKEITVASWRKFYRIVNKALSSFVFSQRVDKKNNETRIENELVNMEKNGVLVIDIAKLDETLQAFVFGDLIRKIYDLKLGQLGVDEENLPDRFVIFIDELNKYASGDVPKSSPILRQILDISERGRSLGIVLFSAEQFRSAIHERVTGNCSTHLYGRTNAIEISKKDYRFVPNVYKNMMTRLKPGEYIIQNPVFRSLLNIKFPKPLYKQYK